ncbi:MAG: HAMP domain-containing sensor histidine kinase [Bacteroidota bacterium]|nr:HAMP domain-containing sensor histidine kinase [Bacteroidota bacterium]
MKNRIAIKITLIYFITGFLWILFSDIFIESISGSAKSLSDYQTYKGWFFVSITAILLFLLIRNEINKKNKIAADLIIAKEKAEESDRLKSAFLANMSHEIRTPLNGIMGFCELLVDESYNDDEKQKFAKFLDNNSKDLLKLINDIMDISKIQENQFEFTKSSFFLNSILENFYNELQKSELRLMRNQVEFKLIKGNEKGIELFTDPQILTNILQNLINNSFFFTKEGFVRFGYREHASGIEFFVEDSGSGIEDGNKEMIFRPFFKGNNPVIGNKGFGLGLAISKGMVNLLGGELKFESTPNVGSRFYFELDNEHILAKSIK